MSYILEALKKSQRDRELGKVPDITSDSGSDSAESESPSGINPWGILAVVIALAALLIVLYSVFWRQLPEHAASQTRTPIAKQLPTVGPVVNKTAPETAPAAHSSPVKKPTPSPASTITPTPQKATLPVVTKVPESIPEDTSREKRPEVEKIRQEYAEMLQHEQQRPKQPPPRPAAPVKTTVETNSPSAAVVAPDKPAHPAVYELPAEVLSRLPARNIMLQSYSDDPAQRFVIMNSAKLYQGERTADNLRVVEIRTNGLLLEFEGVTFFQAR